MNNEDICIEIAKACGWINCRPQVMWEGKWEDNRGGSIVGEWPTTGVRARVPNYPEDLNAMHEAEKMLLDEETGGLGYEYDLKWLPRVTGAVDAETGLILTLRLWHATARQRAEAFLRTIGK